MPRQISFQLPTRGTLESERKFAKRKVKLIDKRRFKSGKVLKFEDTHKGSLKIKKF